MIKGIMNASIMPKSTYVIDVLVDRGIVIIPNHKNVIIINQGHCFSNTDKYERIHR